MFEGNWKCSKCGGAITQLPFQPRSEEGLTCRDCYMKDKGGSSNNSAPAASTGGPSPEVAHEYAGSEYADAASGDTGHADPHTPSVSDKPKFEGDWKCSSCGNAITSLPFQPRSTENLKCIDCFKASK